MKRSLSRWLALALVFSGCTSGGGDSGPGPDSAGVELTATPFAVDFGYVATADVRSEEILLGMQGSGTVEIQMIRIGEATAPRPAPAPAS